MSITVSMPSRILVLAITVCSQSVVLLTFFFADEIFLTIYRELYFRHVYARLSPDLDDRFHSYENYCSLFNLILNSPGPVPLSLPIDWLYNM